MHAALPTDPIVLVDVEDLAEADLEASLAERLELGGRVPVHSDGAAPADEVGRPVSGTGARPGPADAVALAWAIRRDGAAAAAAHGLGLEAAMLADWRRTPAPHRSQARGGTLQGPPVSVRSQSRWPGSSGKGRPRDGTA